MASMLLGFVAQRFDCVFKLTPKYTERPIRRAKSAIRSRWEIGKVMTRRQPEGRKNASYQVTIDCIFVSDWSKRCTWCVFLTLIVERNITKSTHSQVDLDTQLETNLWNQLFLRGARGRSGVKQGGSISWSHQFLSLIFENQELRDVVQN